MKIFENTFSGEFPQGCVLAFGNFDGVHIGHRHLLLSAKEYAVKNGLAFGIYTFLDSPKFAVNDGSTLSNLSERLSLFEKVLNPDFVYLESFYNVKDFKPSEFVDYIVDKFDCKASFCGENFSFGKNAEGGSSDMVCLMKAVGRSAFVVDSVKINEDVVSSTLIKSLVSEGRVECAENLLGRPYGFTSEVIHGAHLGHTLGFPTINQLITCYAPKYGVYTTIVVIDGKEYMGVTNVGVKPTVSDDNAPVAETFLIDFDGDVYGKNVSVFFQKMLREEKKFSSLEELRENIALNVEQTKLFFKEKYEKN